MMKSRIPRTVPTRSRAERLSITTRRAPKPSTWWRSATKWSSSEATSGYSLTSRSRPVVSIAARSTPQPVALRRSWSTLSSNDTSRQRSPAAAEAAAKEVARRVLPVPVGPDTKVTVSR